MNLKSIKDFLIIFLLLVLVSCGKDNKEIKKIDGDPYFDDLKESFWYEISHKVKAKNFVKERLKDFPVIFDDSVGIGTCYLNSHIKINPFYKDSRLLQRLVYHELAHCILLLEHHEEPNDLMYEYLGNPYYNFNYINRIHL